MRPILARTLQTRLVQSSTGRRLSVSADQEEQQP
jgi:hypothetical protein